jgi:hypothetical protein
MKKLRNTVMLVAVAVMAAMLQTAQATLTTSDTLADLINPNGTYSGLQVGDKTFTGFNAADNGITALTTYDPSQIIVTASESGGIDYLTWSGTISLDGVNTSAQLTLKYILTTTGGAINMIGQNYVGSASFGLLTIDETAATGDFGDSGGTQVGSSSLLASNPNLQEAALDANGNFSIVPPGNVLYVTQAIGFNVNPADAFVTVTDISQSFNQVVVPEPTTMIAGALLLLPFGLGTLRKLRKNRTA